MRMAVLVGMLVLTLGGTTGCKDSKSTPAATQPAPGPTAGATGGGAGGPDAISPKGGGRIPKGPR